MATIKCTVQRSSYYEVYFEYSYTQDIASAKTNLTHSLKLKQLTNGMDFDTVAAVKVAYKVAGVEFYKTERINIDDKGNAGYTITLASGKSTIAHNTSTGVGSFTVEVNTSIESGGWGPGTITLAKKTVSLPTIYMTSIPTVCTTAGGLLGAVSMGDTVQIRTNRKSSSFTHTIMYTFGSVQKVTIKKDVGDSCNWTVPDIARLCNNATSGTATITCTTYNGSTKVGESTCVITVKVPDPTVPKFTNGDVVIGGSNPIQTNARSSNFTHLITYSFNGKTGKVNNVAAKSGIVWSTPADLASSIVSYSGTGTITCTTYNGTANVGSFTLNFTGVVPNNTTFQPKVTDFSISPTGSLPSAFEGIYVQGKTGVQASFTAQSTYSKIDSYKITVDGLNFFGNPATSVPFARGGNFTVTGTVTDKRGYHTIVSRDVDVRQYSIPTIEPDGYKYIVCERSDQDGTYDDAGTHLHVKGRISHTPFLVDDVDINACTIKYQYKAQGSSSWSGMALLMSEMPTDTKGFDVTLTSDAVSLATDKSYSVRLIITDAIGSSSTYEFAIPTADVTLHLGYGGYGVAVGKYSEATPDKKMFEVADDWDLVTHGEKLADFVIQQGTSEGWNYRKWESGVVEFWGTFESVAVTKAAHIPINDIFYAGYASMLCPKMLQNVDVVNYSIHWTNGYDWCGKSVVSNGKINFYIVSITDAPDTVQINAHIIGRWK